MSIVKLACSHLVANFDVTVLAYFLKNISDLSAKLSYVTKNKEDDAESLNYKVETQTSSNDLYSKLNLFRTNSNLRTTFFMSSDTKSRHNSSNISDFHTKNEFAKKRDKIVR